MSQLLLPDNIPTLAVGSTTSVTLASTSGGQSTLITIGGQQYSPSSTLTLNTGGTGANGLDTGSLGAIQLWYVYAIASSSTFTPALVASQTGPATGPSIPSGYYSAYKLVGAFYTTGGSVVGSIVTLSGPATTDAIAWTPTGSWSTNTTYTGQFWRKGSRGVFYAKLALSGAPTSTALFINMPTGLTINSSLIDISQYAGNFGIGNAVHATNPVGSLQVLGNSSTSNVQILYQANTSAGQGNVTATNPVTWASADTLEFWWEVPISGWNPTLL